MGEVTPFWRRFRNMPDIHFHRRRGLNTYTLVWGEGHNTKCEDAGVCERLSWAEFVRIALGTPSAEGDTHG